MNQNQSDKKGNWFTKLFNKGTPVEEPEFTKLGTTVEEDSQRFFKDAPKEVAAKPEIKIDKDTRDMLKDLKKRVNPEVDDLIVRGKEKEKKKESVFFGEDNTPEEKAFDDALDKLEKLVEYCKKNRLEGERDWKHANIKMEKTVQEFVKVSIALADKKYEEQTALSMDSFSQKMYKKPEEVNP